MKNEKVNGNSISLLITNAEISSVSFSSSGKISALCDLMVGNKTLTSVTLGNESWRDDNDPGLLVLTRDVSSLRDQLFEIVRKSSVLSLERIQNLIARTPEEAIEDE